MFLCCNTIRHRHIYHYPYCYWHEAWLRPEYKPPHYGYLKTWNIVIEGIFWGDIHLLHHYIIIFEGILWVALVYLVLTELFLNLSVLILPLIWCNAHLLHHSDLSFHKIYPSIHSWLHSGRPNVSFYHDKWVSTHYSSV